MTLSEFQALCSLSLTVRQRLADLDDQTLQPTNTPDFAYEVFLA
jgi:hypothetical protein